jgi:hypothetical protein
MEYTLATEAGEVFVIDPETRRPRGVGEEVGLHLGGGGIAVLPA